MEYLNWSLRLEKSFVSIQRRAAKRTKSPLRLWPTYPCDTLTSPHFKKIKFSANLTHYNIIRNWSFAEPLKSGKVTRFNENEISLLVLFFRVLLLRKTKMNEDVHRRWPVLQCRRIPRPQQLSQHWEFQDSREEGVPEGMATGSGRAGWRRPTAPLPQPPPARHTTIQRDRSPEKFLVPG